MSEDVNEKLDTAIVKMAEQVKAQPDAQKALHYSQAALNLAHTKSVLDGSKGSPAGLRKTS